MYLLTSINMTYFIEFFPDYVCDDNIVIFYTYRMQISKMSIILLYIGVG